MPSNTLYNIGTRKSFPTLGHRNFESDQSGSEFSPVEYGCNKEGLNFIGTAYHVGDVLPFNVAGTTYSSAALAQLQLYWDQGWLTPLA